MLASTTMWVGRAALSRRFNALKLDLSREPCQKMVVMSNSVQLGSSAHQSRNVLNILQASHLIDDLIPLLRA